MGRRKESRMKYKLWTVLGVAGTLAGVGAGAQTGLPSPSAEPGRLEAPQPESSAGEAAPTAAPNSTAPEDPRVARLMADRQLKRGGPVLGLPPLRATLWPHGLPGWTELSVGGSLGDSNRWTNAALNSQLELAPGLRAHFTGVYRNHQNRLRADLSWQEGYVEGYGFTPLVGGRLGWDLRLGRTSDIDWPYPDPLSLFDPFPFLDVGSDTYLVGYEHLTGLLDWESPTGLGLHAGLNRRFRQAYGGRGDLDVHLIEYYGRYRHTFRGGYDTELRFGALNPREGFLSGLTPRWPQPGGSLYFGKQWAHGSAGLMVERLRDQSTRYGFRINVSADKVTSFIGHFLGRYQRENHIVTAQIPLVQLWTGQSPHYRPPLFAQRVGEIDATRMYRTGTWLQRDVYPLNYEYILRRLGTTSGPGLIRVVHEGPRALSEFGMMDSHMIRQAEVVSRFRQDVTYDLYRVPKLGTATLNIRLVNKLKPSESVPQASIEAVDQVGRKQLLTAPQGQVDYTAMVPIDRPQKATLKITAPGFLPETTEVQLAAGNPEPAEIPLRPATGILTGKLLDAATGEPIPEVEVVLTGGGGSPKVLLTDARGEFQAADLQPGRYAVATHAPRYRDQRVPAEIVAGEQNQVEIRLEARPASIAGKLLTADGKPVAGATITLRDDAGNPVGSLTTLADGSFGTTGLKPGTYTLQARTPDGRMVDSTIKLTGGEIATIELRLP
jgi:Carboxypeptidase regulatory-like domain